MAYASNLKESSKSNPPEIAKNSDLDNDISDSWQWSMDSQLRIKSMSRQFTEVLGKQAGREVLGKTLWEFAEKEQNPPPLWISFHKRLKEHRPFEKFVFPFQGSKGMVSIEVSGTPIFEHDTFRGYQGTGSVLETSPNSDNILLSDDLLGQTAKQMAIGLAIFDNDGVLLEFNDFFFSLFPETQNAIHTGTSWSILARKLVYNHHFQTTNPENFIFNLIKTFEAQDTFHMQLSSGEWYKLEFNQTQNHNRNHICLSVHNVTTYYNSLSQLTDQHQITRHKLQHINEYLRLNAKKLRHPEGEDEIHDMMDQLQTLKEKANRLFVSPHQGILVTSPTGEIISANPTLCRMLGLLHETELKRTLKSVHNGLYSQSALRGDLENNALSQGVFTAPLIEWRHLRSGSPVWVSETIQPIYKDGQLDCYESIILNQTQNYEQQIQYKTLLSQYHFSQNTKKHFLQHLGHEIRTPLGAIIGFSDFMKHRLLGNNIECYEEYIDDILKAGHHILSIVNDTLTVLDFDNTSRKLCPRDVDIVELLNTLCDDYQEKAKQKNITLKTKIAFPEDMYPLLFCDPNYIKESLRRLIENSLRHTPVDGIITLGCRGQFDDSVILFVQDTGQGISEDFLNDILSPFQGFGDNADISRHQQGLGLGLSVANTFAKVHGASLFVKSYEGLGTTAYLQMPPWRTRQNQKLTDKQEEYSFID